jgi:hypothetical protein
MWSTFVIFIKIRPIWSPWSLRSYICTNVPTSYPLSSVFFNQNFLSSFLTLSQLELSQIILHFWSLATVFSVLCIFFYPNIKHIFCWSKIFVQQWKNPKKQNIFFLNSKVEKSVDWLLPFQLSSPVTIFVNFFCLLPTNRKKILYSLHTWGSVL